MKQTTVALVGLGMALGVGAFFAAPHAEAVTTKGVATHAASSTAGYTFILGEDGAVWYTVTGQYGSSGATTSATKTGNAGNVFEGASFGANGFVNKTSLSTNCSDDTCAGIWVKTPGAGGFNDRPNLSIGGPICNLVATGTTAGVGGTAVSNGTLRNVVATAPQNGILSILVPGLDKNVWYTLYDALGNGGTSSVMCGTAGTNIANSDPFAASGETDDTGWVNTSSTATAGLNKNCNDQSRTCVGIWAAMP